MVTAFERSWIVAVRKATFEVSGIRTLEHLETDQIVDLAATSPSTLRNDHFTVSHVLKEESILQGS